MTKHKLNSKTIIARVSDLGSTLRPYGFVLFVLFVAGLYGSVIIKTNSLINERPTDDAVSSQVKAARVPHFDRAVIKQLESLQDNSVSVEALFKSARDNPFDQN